MTAARVGVYVLSHCSNCDQASRLAAEAAARFPALAVGLVDIDPTRPPEQVVAVPTYVLNGRVTSLGDPDRQDLFAHSRRSSEDRALLVAGLGWPAVLARCSGRGNPLRPTGTSCCARLE